MQACMSVIRPFYSWAVRVQHRTMHSGSHQTGHEEEKKMLPLILLVLLVLLLVGVVPSWPHSRSWGYGPSGILAIVLIVVIVLYLVR